MIEAMRFLVVALAFAIGCGGGAKTGTTPKPDDDKTVAKVTTSRLEIAEISIKEGTQSLLVHADGKVEIVDGDQTQTLGTLTSDGLFTNSTGQTGQLQDDGSFTTPDGPAPFKLDDETLVVGETKLRIEDGTLKGGKVDTSSVAITGVTTRGTRRTALLMIGFILLGN